MLATEMFSNVGIWAFNHAALETSELSCHDVVLLILPLINLTFDTYGLPYFWMDLYHVKCVAAFDIFDLNSPSFGHL
jgi:hypothetical protein